MTETSHGSSFRCLALATLFAGASGCIGTETGNPPFQSEVAFTAYSSSPLEVALDDAAPIQVDAVWLALGEGVFLPDCAPAPAQLAPLGVADHASGDPRARQQITLEDAAYCGLDLRLETADALPQGAPAALERASAVIEGQRADGTPFFARSAFEGAISLRGAFDLDASAPPLLVGFDVARWLEGINLDTAAITGDTIAITPETNADAHRRFAANLPLGFVLFQDEAGDAAVGDDDAQLASGQ